MEITCSKYHFENLAPKKFGPQVSIDHFLELMQILPSAIQSCTQSPLAYWSAGERLERFWDNELVSFFLLVVCIITAVRQGAGK